MCKKSFPLLFFYSFFFLICGCETKHSSEVAKEKPPSSIIQDRDTTSLDEFEKLISEYESEDRDEWQHPEIILKSIGNLKGKSVADIGAGTGYFSFKLAKTADTVYAVDIDERFLQYIEERKEGLLYGLGENVITMLTKPDSPGEFFSKVDIVLLVNTYSYLNNRVSYFRKVRRLLKPRGSVFIVDFKEKNTPIGPPSNSKVSSEVAQRELKSAGFKAFRVDSTSLPFQYILKAS